MRARALSAAAALVLVGCAHVPPAGARGRGPAVASWARRQVGRRYRSGGSSPAEGFDCSGLAWWSYRQAGVDIPPTAASQFGAGRPVPRSELLPGDLVFFTIGRRGPSHVGVYVGGGSFVHAPRAGERVRRARLADPYWRRRFLGARRYW